MSWARSVPKEEDQTEGGIRPVVVRKKGRWDQLSVYDSKQEFRVRLTSVQKLANPRARPR